MMDIPSARRSRRSRGYQDLLKNVGEQVAGSDLLRGYSFVYVWLANQFGHFMIGFAGTILFSWFAFLAFPNALTGEFWPRLWAAVLIGALWLLAWIGKELLVDLVGGMRLLKLVADQRNAALRGAPLPDSKLPPWWKIGVKDLRYIGEALRTYWTIKPRSAAGAGEGDSEGDWFVYDIVRDSRSDVWFYLAGGLTAVAMYAAPGLAPGAWWPWLVPIATFVIVLVASFFAARDWLGEKVAFDQAGLPFVRRFVLNNRPAQQNKRRILMSFATGTRPEKEHLVIIGPPKSGRTTTAVALGVEALLRSGNSTVLYTTWCKLLDRVAEEMYFAQQDQQLQGPEMRPTFPPEDVELLIIDDVGAEGAQRRPFVMASVFGDELKRNDELRKMLSDKRVVWVVGDDPKNGEDWIRALEDVFGYGKVEAVEPGETIARTARYQSRRAA